MADVTWTSETVPIAGAALHVARAGSGTPLLLLHHDIGTLERLPFYDALAQQFTVLIPSHPGYDKSERPAWMRNVRDVAVVHQWLLGQRGLTDVSIVGLGFGGWIAAEMATMAPRAFKRLVLVGVTTPTLVVWGRKDRVVPLECGERYVKALPQARLSVIEGAGHFVEMEKPDELSKLVGGFLCT